MAPLRCINVGALALHGVLFFDRTHVCAWGGTPSAPLLIWHDVAELRNLRRPFQDCESPIVSGSRPTHTLYFAQTSAAIMKSHIMKQSTTPILPSWDDVLSLMTQSATFWSTITLDEVTCELTLGQVLPDTKLGAWHTAKRRRTKSPQTPEGSVV